jgi:peptidoglycan/LPS O-acetylase OafA/YrhL
MRAGETNYRPDIDGLRAIAVSLVVVFHSGLFPLQGGFVGVDVFFVISGYLITGLLLAEFRSRGDISFRSFFARRVSRLAPALLFTILIVLAASTYFLSRIGNETGPASKAAIATLLLNANHFFLAASGDYFAAAAETNPFLHMWSLSVEEQFYLIWPPLLLFVLRSVGPRRWSVAVCSMLLIAWVVGWAMVGLGPTANFYLMPARGWELLAGAGLAASISSRSLQVGAPVAAAVGLIGLAMIAWACISLAGGQQFPFPAGMVPVVGSVFVILAGCISPANAVTKWIGVPAMTYLGKISYPLYLWHWPVLVLLRGHRLYEVSWQQDLFAVVLSLFLAVLTYELVEKRGRVWFSAARGPGMIMLRGAAISLGLIAAAALLGAWVRFGWGYSQKDQWLASVRLDSPRTGCLGSVPENKMFLSCYPKREGDSVLLWGDSHATQWGPAVRGAADAVGVHLGIAARGGCRPLRGSTGYCAQAVESTEAGLSVWQADRGLKGIILAASWGHGMGLPSPTLSERTAGTSQKYFDARATSSIEALALMNQSLTRLLDKTDALGLRLLIVLPSPVQRYKAPHCLSMREPDVCQVTMAEMERYSGEVERLIRRVTADRANVRLLDPKAFLCHDGLCPTVIDGIVAYQDESHLSDALTITLGSYFIEEMRWLAGDDLKAPGAETASSAGMRP